MLTGIAVLGLLAGSLAEFFHLEEKEAEERPAETARPGATEPVPVSDELTALQSDLCAFERRLADIARRTRTESSPSSSTTMEVSSASDG
jgi:hypothetical protein